MTTPTPTTSWDRTHVLEWIQGRSGKFFRVRFVKRSDGSVRDMLCRKGVKKHLKGGKRPDFEGNGLISVYDVVKAAYRAIPIEGILEVKIQGVWVKVIDPEQIKE